MASPQLENGFTRIANELLEALCRLKIPGSEMRVLLYIIRRTYGFNRKSAMLSLAEISAGVSIRKEHISKILKRLAGWQIITVVCGTGAKPQKISLQKDCTKWQPLQNNATVARDCNTELQDNATPAVAQDCNATVAQDCNHTYKENNKEINIENFKESKKAYGQNGKVLLTESEYSALVSGYGQKIADSYISRMDRWLSARNAKLSDYYSEILIWLERDGVKKSDFDVSKYDFVINNF